MSRRSIRAGEAASLLLACVLTLAASSAVLSSSAPAGATSHPPADHSAVDTGATSDPTPLTLVHQTAFVPNQVFTVQVRTGTGLPPKSDLALDVSAYDCVGIRSTLEQISTNGPSPDNRLGSTGELRLDALPTVAGADGDGSAYQVSVGLNVDGVSPTAPYNGSSIDLSSCSRVPGAAEAGVYPATVVLENVASHHVISQFTTYFARPAGAALPAKRLRVAVVVPISTPVTPDSNARAGSATALSSGQANRLAQVVATVASHAQTAAVTVNATPQTVQDLAATGKSGPATLRLLQQVVPLRDEALDQPYVPIDADTLAASGMGSEVTAQKNRGHQVLALSGVHATSSPSVWLAQQTVDGGAADAVAALGAQEAVIPASSFESTPSGGFTSRVMLSLGHGNEIPAAASDTALTREFTADPEDPALAAYQMLADLELIYWELPNADQARGVVAVPPTSWQADPTFLNTLLSNLGNPGTSTNPYLQPLTLSDFFTQVPVESGGGTRSLAGGNGNTLPSSFVSAVRHNRGKVDSFTATTSGAGSEIDQLGDALLTSESSELSRQGRSVALQGFNSALDAQLSQIQLTTDRTITLTSRTAALPVTILSSAPYTVIAILSLSSAKLEFPPPGASGSTGPSKTDLPVKIDRSTTALRVQVVTRTSGDLPVSVSLTSRDGGLVLVHGRLTVRSTAFSVVGIVLTALALAVLLGWWVRSSISRRRARAAEGQPSRP